MLDRIKPRRAQPVRAAVRTAVAMAVGAAVFGVAVLGAAPGLAQAATPGSSSTTSATATAKATVAPTATAAAAPQTIGGPKLSSRGVVVDYASKKAPRLPDIQTSSFVVAEASTGQVLAGKDPHGYYRPASTLKMLTAATLIPLLNPNSTVVASKLATSTVPNVVGLVTGRAYQISDLFTALLTISANDAAIALTQATGSFSKGMALINAEARQLQADDTVAVEPNGLDAPGQHTSAYDLALIAQQALKEPAFLKYDGTLSARFVVKRYNAVTLDNQNSLLTNYQGAVGGKIGWTSAAGATYVGMATRHGVTLIVTLLHCPALTEVKSAETLLNWGFSAAGKVTPVGTLVSPLPPPAPKPAAKAAAAAPVQPLRVQAVSRPRTAAASPSVLAAAGFSCATVAAAVVGFAYSRRQRLRAAAPGRYRT